MNNLDKNRGGTPSKKFRLSQSRGKIMGVCSGLGDYFGVDTTLIRIAFVIGAFLSVGTAGLVYLAVGLIAD
ncbi:PspC domain-containing protein [Altererythrobacter sp. ZODW24]|uniref:PspC domain-containing protein n=1 Tax=Altererythrobacter sp. ZODW24 TaxID=2185142 RepID=UPI000DF7F3E5|nr:PspC domain-containing protein [Altererythrobacter sp. ZODW24]